ncbi:MAG TPA: YceI family protein [Chloroflexota bacterium]|nr:YceI family protein [Chloroflexota bacterium]
MVAAQSTAAGVGTWQIDPGHAVVEFSGKHMMFSTVKGRFQGVQGTVAWNEADPANSRVVAEIDAASLVSGSNDRDTHLRSADFLDVETYPTIRFESVRIEPQGADRARVVGNLTIKDVTRPVELDARLTGRGRSPWGQEIAGFAATTSINRKDWGLTWNVALEAGGWLVGDKLDLSLDFEAVKQG